MTEEEEIDWFNFSPKEMKIYIQGVLSGAVLTLCFVALAWMILLLFQL